MGSPKSGHHTACTNKRARERGHGSAHGNALRRKERETGVMAIIGIQTRKVRKAARTQHLRKPRAHKQSHIHKRAQRLTCEQRYMVPTNTQARSAVPWVGDTYHPCHNGTRMQADANVQLTRRHVELGLHLAANRVHAPAHGQRHEAGPLCVPRGPSGAPPTTMYTSPTVST